MDDITCLDHWHSINSTNWTTVRLKVPEGTTLAPWQIQETLKKQMQLEKKDPTRKRVAGQELTSHGLPEMPWRVEVRAPEVQLSDFENASIVVLLQTLVKWFRTSLVEAEEKQKLEEKRAAEKRIMERMAGKKGLRSTALEQRFTRILLKSANIL